MKSFFIALNALPPDEYCKLGVMLGLEFHHMKKIERDNANNCQIQLLGIIQSWINLSQSVSWLTLAETLEDMSQSALASKIRTFYE